MYQRIKFTTEDSVIIVGDYYALENPRGWALLLHMMPAVKESWQELAKALNNAGFSCLAIDLRGHGESIYREDGTTLNYKDFSDEEHQQKIVDVRAAVSWLKEQGAEEEKLAVIGGSIGANLSLQYLTESKKVPTAVLLSPGLDYRGIKTEPLVKLLSSDKSFLCVAAKDDEHGSFQTCQRLTELASAQSENIRFDQGGHATNMFNSQPQLINQIIDWIKNRV